MTRPALPGWASITPHGGRWRLSVRAVAPDGTRVRVVARAGSAAPLERLVADVAGWLEVAGGVGAAMPLEAVQRPRGRDGPGCRESFDAARDPRPLRGSEGRDFPITSPTNRMVPRQSSQIVTVNPNTRTEET